jgi:hypothetical protein
MEKADRISANIPLSAKYAQLNLDPLSLSIKAAQVSFHQYAFINMFNQNSSCLIFARKNVYPNRENFSSN